MRLDSIKIRLPIVDARYSENYALIITDSAGVEHYFNFDGSYDGWSHAPCVDRDTGTCMN